MNIQSTIKKEKFMGLEWLRFFLGIIIVIYHTLHTYPEYKNITHYITDLGFVATSCFFILSGFLLTHVYFNWKTKQGMRESNKSFWLKRFANLYPIHIGSLLFFIFVVYFTSFLGILPYDQDASIRNVTLDVNKTVDHHLISHQMSYMETIVVFFLNIFMLQSWNPFYLSFNLPAWSISTLFTFYIIFPYIVTNIYKIKKTILFMVLNNIIYLLPVLFVILFTGYDSPETGILHRNPILRLPEFISGILLCFIYHKRNTDSKSNYISISFMLIFFASMIGATYILKEIGNTGYYLIHNGLLLIPETMFIYAFAILKFDFGNKVNKVASLLGSCTLPMFALHIPIFMLFARFERVIKGNPILCFSNWELCVREATNKSIIFYPLYIILTILICIFFQQIFVTYFKNKILKKN